MMMKIYCSLLVAFAALLPVSAFAAVDNDVGIEVYTTQPFQAGSAIGYCRIKIANRRKSYNIRIEAVVKKRGYYSRESNMETRFVTNIESTPGEKEVEIYPILARGSECEIKFFVNGSLRDRLTCHLNFTSTHGHRHYSSSNDSVVFVVGSGSLNVVKGLDKVSDVSSSQILGRNLPNSWHGYIGLESLLMVEDVEIYKLSISAQEALRNWVQFAGGVLWVYGPDCKNAAKRLGLSFDKIYDEERASFGKCATGYLRLVELENLEETATMRIKADLQKIYMASRLQDLSAIDDNRYYYRSRSSNSNAYSWLFNDLHVVPRVSYFVISLLLGILIGPVNFLVLKKRKKLPWFYLTAPVLALSGMAVLFFYSLVHDGISLKYKEQAVLIHNVGDNTGAIYNARAVYAPIAPSRLEYATNEIALPFLARDANRNSQFSFSTNWSNNQTLTGSWVTSRSQNGLFSISPLTQVRMGLKVESVSETKISVENELGSTVKNFWIRHKRKGSRVGPYFIDREIAPGEKVVVEIPYERGERPLDRSGVLALSELNWSIIASVTNLPYLRADQGGISGEVLAGDYYYIALAGGVDSND